VDISLLNAEGAASPGTCNNLQIQFPGKTGGGEILSAQSFQMPGVPGNFLKRVDAGARLTKRPGIGDGEELSVSLAGVPPVPPNIRFVWIDAATHANFVTNQVSLPLAPITVNGSSLVPIKHVELDLAVPNELEDATSSPTPSSTFPLGNDRLDKYDFPSGASVVNLKWTDSIRSLIKEVGVVVFSLLAGAAISDLVTAHPERKSGSFPPQNSPPGSKRRRRP
jgi:hypothetical protein